MTRATHFGLHPWQGWKRPMSDSPIPNGIYWATEIANGHRCIARVSEGFVSVIGSESAFDVAEFENYVPVLSEAEVAELEQRLDAGWDAVRDE